MITLNQDNQWHPAVLVKFKDGNFGLFDDLPQAEQEASGRVTGEYEDVKYNWNKGQPLVNVGGRFTISIVDIQREQPS